MGKYLIGRITHSGVLLLFTSALVYFILYLVPGGPFDQLRTSAAGSAAAQEAQIKRLNQLLGLDRPWHERYGRWLSKAVRGDFGTSWSVALGQPVGALIRGRLANTFLLMGVSALISLLLAIPIGVYSAVKQYSPGDYVLTAFSYFGISMPTFWFGVMMLIVFAVVIPIFPAGGASTLGREGDLLDRARYLVMPATVLSLFQVAGISRFVRSSMLEVLRQDYMRTARAKGVAWHRVVLKHGLPNAMLPVITLLGLEIPQLFGGAIITETIFAWPGIGRLFLSAIESSDWPLVQAITMISALLVVAGNLCADLCYAWIDPRITYD